MGGWRAGKGLWTCRFSAFHDRPSLEICQSSEKCSEHARNGLGTTTWIRFWSCWSLLSLACCTQFISAVIWNLRFPFFWSCVCHYKRFTTLRTRPVNMFLDARPFDYVFLFRRLTRLKEGPTPFNTYVEEFVFSSEKPKINSSWY